MPIDPDVAIDARLPDRSFSWDSSDVLLYHLAVGAGSSSGDHLSPAALRYTLDDDDLQVLPSFGIVAPIFHETDPPPLDLPGCDIDLAQVVHGSQAVEAQVRFDIRQPHRQDTLRDGSGVARHQGAQRRASHDGSHASRRHLPDHRLAAGTERHSDSDLVPCLSHHVRDDAVDARRRERQRDHRKQPGQSDQCTLRPEHDFNVLRLAASFADVQRADVDFRVVAGQGLNQRLEDVAIDRERGEIVLLFPGDLLRPLGKHSIAIDLHARSSSGDRIHASYALQHTPWA